MRLVSILLNFALVPVLLRVLGTHDYATYVLVTTVPALLGVGDLGLGNGLLTALAALQSRRDRAADQRSLISSATAVVAVVSSFVSIGLLIAAGVQLTVQGSLPFNLTATTYASIMLYVVLTILAVPLALTGKVLLAIGENRTAARWSGIAALGPPVVAFVCAARSATLPVLLMLLAVTGFAIQVGTARACYGLATVTWPRLREVDWATSRRLLASSAGFVVLLAAGTVAFQTDVFVIAAKLTAEDVATYNLVYRVFTLPVTLATFAVTPLWARIAQAHANGALPALAESYRRISRIIIAGGTVCAIALFAVGQEPYSLITGGVVRPPVSLLAACGALSVILTLELPYATALNGVGLVKRRAILSVVALLINLPFTWFATDSIGVQGPAVGSLVAVFALIVLPEAYLVRQVFNRAGIAQVVRPPAPP